MFVWSALRDFAIIHRPGVDEGTATDPDDSIEAGKAAEHEDHSGEDPSLDSEEENDGGTIETTD
jgi:hypothetical protein